MKRGDVYWADLAPRSGSEQKGRRPVIIVSHDGFNLSRGWNSVIVVPTSTSQAQAKRGATGVLLPVGEGGLAQESVALCHQVTTLDRSKLLQKIGALSAVWLAKVEQGLVAALDLP
ncbi:MAG: type II toxin-antitoxin system PemK/MazF family toxin [Acidobacteria bacterium]|nr:type II toxin-antitoxin system PemK/MazF family toxin [Acidobacteriota bacterium]MBI3424055.1 type II toxin-antitoxin system PemK/MazF family toxin [Acidobacteriota bacterium]